MSNNMNQATHPFWDFVASMQDPRNQSFASAGNQPRGPPPPPPPGQGFGPFEGQFPWGPWGGMPHRGRDHGRRSPPPPEHDRDGHSGPPGPPGPPPHHHHHHDHKGNGPRGPKPHHGSSSPSAPPGYGSGDEKDMPPPPHDVEDPPSRAPTPPTPDSPPTEPRHRGHSPHGHGPRGHGPRGHGPHGHGPHGHGPHGRGGRCGGRGGRGGRWGGRGGHGPGPWGHHGFGGPGGHRHHGPEGPGGPRGPGGPFPFDLSSLIEAFAPGLINNNANGTALGNRDTNSNNDGMFNPDLDLFDTVEAYILHLSLPGAKKPDLSITYSSTRNSVTISGVVTRPGVDEEMMDALALDERKVGAFEREVKLEDGVKIDEDGISAKLEDGVLRVVVPKMMQEEDEDYVDVKRITLE